MEKSESILNLAKAMVQVQKELKPAQKNAVNPHFKSKYADLESVWDACRDVLVKNKLTVLQFPETVNGGVRVSTMLVHESGEWVRSDLDLPQGDRPTAQTIGSAITYGRRYGLSAVVGICSEDDDDGNAGSQVTTAPSPPARAESKPAPRATSPTKLTDDTVLGDKLTERLISDCNKILKANGIPEWSKTGDVMTYAILNNVTTKGPLTIGHAKKIKEMLTNANQPKPTGDLL